MSLFQILPSDVDWTDSCAQRTPKKREAENTEHRTEVVKKNPSAPAVSALLLARAQTSSPCAHIICQNNTRLSQALDSTPLSHTQGPLISVKGFSKLPFSFSRLHPQKQYYNLHLIYWFMQFPFLHNFRITSSLSSHRFLHLKLQVTFDLIWILHSTHQARLHRS